MAKRNIPKKIAAQVSPEHLAILQEALEHFDGNYRSLMDHLKALNAPQVVYMMVNGSIKSRMNKGRQDVSLSNNEEMQVWGDGYDYTQARMEDLSDPAQNAWDGFTQSLIENNWEL
ncbi:hypothetical protein [Leptothoe sp. PORK10 BA2]|uniref:hypothetical protein n=1 Tax=Leptothoe sp. PORK10 BA2 TaxID=3110254 RepID=UPI002B2065D8|nr:hypothetical protein [Leptothoe sp. PORK10 BA2]MEA5465294.1 hypothetical protein [Leptothoe sp. PORK10 BA2]